MLVLSMGRFAAAELVELTLGPGSFPDPSSVSVLVDAGLLGDDEVVTSVSGTLGIELLPSAISPTEAQVVALDLLIDDEVDVRVGGGFLLPTVTVEADAGQIRVLMAEPGDVGEINRGRFDQLGNLVRFEGTARTSVQTDPIDLSEFEPTGVDFEDIAVQTDRTEITLDTAFFTELDIPIDAGLIRTTVTLVVDGGLEATGSVPPANYVWQGPTSSGSIGDFADPDNWLRGEAADTNTIPIAIDSATLRDAIDLNGIREVASTRVARDSHLIGGTLNTDTVEIPMDSQLTISGDANLNAATSASLAVSGGGRLTVAGNVTSPIELQDGILASGGGKVSRVDVAADGILELSSTELLVADEIFLLPGSQFQITGDAVEAGTYPLTDSLDAFSLDGLYQTPDGQAKQPTIQYNDTPLTVSGGASGTQHAATNVFEGYVGDGLFAALDLRSDSGFALILSSATPGDTDGNGRVEFADFLVVSANFGNAGDWSAGDFDGNGRIEFADFLILSDRFGDTVAAQPVPEPNSLQISVSLLACVLFVRRQSRTEFFRL